MLKKTIFVIAAVGLSTLTLSAQIYRLSELNANQIRKLDKTRTAVIIPGGILEEHGPYLPIFTDGFWNEEAARKLATRIAAKPGWTAVIFPTIPLGNSGANDIGGRYSYPGTYSVRFSTLRSVFMDLASELGKQKFRWVFVLHGHGAPNHVRALDQAGDYFRDIYGGHMMNLAGLLPVIASWDGKKTELERREDGLPIHAGMDETSMMLALKPELVDPGYKSSPPFSGERMEDLIRIASMPDWPGYFGSPRLARTDQYRNGWEIGLNEAVEIALKILDGLDERTIPRFGDEMKKSMPDVELDRKALQHEALLKRKQEAWLLQRNL
jgi:creatinine amidohydrolase/Fe(II)-dependent formamide hydrolase-like protein